VCCASIRALRQWIQATNWSSALRSPRLAEPDLYQVYVKTRVFDEDAFWAAAQDVYFETWGQEDWEPDNLEEALYELVLASNSNPSPSNLGFEIVDWRPLE
jgi:hypothetical protein